MQIRSLLWIPLALFLAYAAYRITIILMKKYYNPNIKGILDDFQGKQTISTPAPSVVKESAPLMEPTGALMPAGPNPPNAAAPPDRQTEILPQETANDPL